MNVKINHDLFKRIMDFSDSDTYDDMSELINSNVSNKVSYNYNTSNKIVLDITQKCDNVRRYEFVSDRISTLKDSEKINDKALLMKFMLEKDQLEKIIKK